MDNYEQVSITAFIITGNEKKNSCNVKFPTTTEEIHSLLKVDNIDDCKIESVSCEAIPFLPNYIGYSGNDTTINELQYISKLIANLTEDEREIFSAYLEVYRFYENITAKDVMDALENINTMTIDTTLKTAEEIGDKWFYDTLKDIEQTKRRLLTTNDPKDVDLYIFIDKLQECFVPEACGYKICEDNDMYPTSKGIVTVDWDTFVRRESRQVPDDIKISEKIKPSILKQVEENKNKIAQADNSGKKQGKETIGIE